MLYPSEVKKVELILLQAVVVEVSESYHRIHHFLESACYCYYELFTMEKILTTKEPHLIHQTNQEHLKIA